LIAALSPAVLEQLGLGAALRQLVNRFQRLHPCRVRLQLSKMGALPQQLEIIAYRLVQECFNNIGKHSGATHVNISLASADGHLNLIVEDNGVGFNVEEALAKRDSFGLSGMRERVALLGGTFQAESRMESPKRGTKISIELPIASSTRGERPLQV
jgi:two-component system, NarL family, sensor histidine kinase DegS